MIYDVIILGGGIAGMNCVYQLLKKSPNAHILLLEKDTTLGGRVYTAHTSYMDVEAGAGRFHSGQLHTIKLIRDLGLVSRMAPITSNASYADGSGKFISSVLNPSITEKTTPRKKSIVSTIATNAFPDVEPTIMAMVDHLFGKEALPNAWLIAKIVIGSYLEEEETLMNISLLDFAKKILNEAEVELLQNSFGYYSELVIMNAKDALHLIVAHLTPQNAFYVLNGGLSQLITKMESFILKHMHARILKNRQVNHIRHITWKGEDMFEISCSNVNTIYYGKQCICALPKSVVEKIGYFSRISPMLSKIKCAPLCRIYSKFPTQDTNLDGKKIYGPWFKGLPKLTSNSNLRMVIPMNERNGLIMSSYSDNKFAKFWKRLYDKEGESGVNRELIRLLHKNTGRSIPMPIKTEVYYWDCGVGYWGVGADSAKIAKALIQPYGESVAMFLCGEHYSEKNQQWIEGALETSMKVVSRITL